MEKKAWSNLLSSNTISTALSEIGVLTTAKSNTRMGLVTCTTGDLLTVLKTVCSDQMLTIATHKVMVLISQLCSRKATTLN
jgi:hypothetical protein